MQKKLMSELNHILTALESELAEAKEESDEELLAWASIVYEMRGDDPSSVVYTVDYALKSEPKKFAVIADALKKGIYAKAKATIDANKAFSDEWRKFNKEHGDAWSKARARGLVK